MKIGYFRSCRFVLGSGSGYALNEHVSFFEFYQDEVLPRPRDIS